MKVVILDTGCANLASVSYAIKTLRLRTNRQP
ncbi:imidazole glycerol phosphate synthase subunit HisH [Providencia alcalifaciens]|nr:imidazole glycerol phosphate synthase subunit HisH [Providencia alcalifaciens]